MIRTLVILAMLMLTGCNAVPSGNAGREAIGDVIGRNARAAEALSSIQDVVGTLATSVDPVVNALAKVMTKTLERAKANVDMMGKRIVDLGKAFALQDAKIIKQGERIAYLESCFVGPRGWLVIWGIGIWWIICLVLKAKGVAFAAWLSPAGIVLGVFRFVVGLFVKKPVV